MMYDLIVVGGGVGGSTLAKIMAEHGARVLVLERQPVFADRVRGEAIVPWGIVEARTLGIYEPLLHNGGQELGVWLSSPDGVHTDLRDLFATTPQHTGCLTCYHPTMQTILLDLAARAGAEVRRGVTVVNLRPGEPAAVYVQERDWVVELTARLVVGADGRASRMRQWGGFDIRHDQERLAIASVLQHGLPLREDAVHEVEQPSIGQTVLIFPIGQQRFRTYLMYRKRGGRRGLTGHSQIAAFIQTCIQTGAPAAWYEHASTIGPLAEFEGAASWVDHPYRDGVALVGDAAGASDPSFGMGLSLTLRDVRVLGSYLQANDDWETTLHEYATEHDQYFGALNRIIGWLTELFFEVGPAAEARRAYVMARHQTEPERGVSLLGLGPDQPSDEAARRRFFAED
ncbi:MAG TPA: FAD-dependent monooxygenase [Roseiflexaceae bacterium]|nr:FAD-dependent monooxygenase [Roseiflexaceae bacterium]